MSSSCQTTPKPEAPAWEQAYPWALRCAEAALLQKRDSGSCRSSEDSGATQKELRCARFGLALSGGGIRSATFAFGVIQAFARKGILKQVDVLSTVSGGGYAGSLLARLFSREWVKSHDDVRQAILPAWESTEKDASSTSGESSVTGIRSGAVLRWLRDNGRYLAPNGSDVLLNGAILLRNWLSVHTVLIAFVLALFVFMQALRAGVLALLGDADAQVVSGCVADLNSFASVAAWLTCYLPFGETHLWWSPWLLAPAVVLVVVAVPLGLAYWLAYPLGHKGRGTYAKVWHWLSSRFSEALAISGVLLGFALVDTLGQTIYALGRMPGAFLYPWFAAGFVGVVAAFASARWLAALFSGPRGPRFRVPLSVAAGVGGFLLLAAWLVTINIGAHAIAWRFDFPQGVPEKLFARRASEAEGCTPQPLPCRHLATFQCPQDCPALGQRDGGRTLGAALFLAALTLLFGRCWSFLNDSSLLPLYTARLTRAYLGASNSKRLGKQSRVPVTRVLDDDDVPLHWSQHIDADNEDPFRKGAPLHLINVTINETLDGKLKLQQSGRKGIGMAVGPAGLSAGVRHHVVLGETVDKTPVVFPQHGYRMFDYGGGEFKGMDLSYGQWVAISGAAFSTGLGRRTRLGLSLLAGFFNVRLGFWWDSGVKPSTRSDVVRRAGYPARLGAMFTYAFPVQSYLLDEFLGRFHGSARRRWCLTDGGHFDNTGVYELLRRRVPLILAVDAEADPDFRFDGLGNLVRKARADFDAEFEFLDEGGLCGWAGDQREALRDVRALEELRPLPSNQHSSGDAPAEAGAGSPISNGRKPEARSDGHAAIALVRYEGKTEPGSVLIYMKPTLVGDEPIDIRHYTSENPEFPHQGTVDQFFDEAQWESYRKLGELIAERVFSNEAFELFRGKAGLTGSAD